MYILIYRRGLYKIWVEVLYYFYEIRIIVVFIFDIGLGVLFLLRKCIYFNRFDMKPGFFLLREVQGPTFLNYNIIHFDKFNRISKLC